METHKIFIILFVAVFIFYFTQQVPYCKYPPEIQNVSVKTVYSSQEVLQLQSYNVTLLHVKGESMFPSIFDDSTCLCVKEDNYKIGDIIFFTLKYKDGNMAILHRINQSNETTFITKGDNNDFLDPLILKEDVVCTIPEVPRYLIFSN